MKYNILKFGSLPVLAYGSLFAQQQKPVNVVFVLADEWRAQATGYAGDPNVKTPQLDNLAKSSVTFSNAISCCPVSGPYRASLLTGQYPLTTGFFINDVELNPEAQTIGKVFRSAGYKTAYIGKWHLDGHGRSSFIPQNRRQGFDYWKVLECEHNYNNSFYWDNDDTKKKWAGYDVYAQTTDAIQYINARHQDGNPFMMVLSWGPPHTPFESAPESFKQQYIKMELKLRQNIPAGLTQKAREELIGYYAHITAMDSCIGALRKSLTASGLDKNTIFVFTSDHGAMVESQGMKDKQCPYDESIRIPLIINFPKSMSVKNKPTNMLINTPDLMPTLLGLCKLPIPSGVEGTDKSTILSGISKDTTQAVLIASYHPFGQWPASKGGKEYRGVRTKRYTYVRDLKGPWLLFDNQKDPFQLKNLITDVKYQKVCADLERKLKYLLAKTNDDFKPGMEYIKKWGYVVDKTGTAPYNKINFRGEPIENGISGNK